MSQLQQHGNAVDFGDLTDSIEQEAVAALSNSSTRGIFAAGYNPS